MRLTKFVIPQYEYTLTFPAQTFGNTTFGGMSPNTIVFPNGWGGVDTDGAEGARRNIGNVRTSFFIEADPDLAALVSGIRDVMRTKNLGRGRLFSAPADGSATRWVWAKVNNVTVSPETPQSMPHKRRLITIDFQVVSPRWYSRTDATYDANTGNPTTTGVRSRQTAYENFNRITLTNNGDEFAPAVVTVQASLSAWQIGDDVDIGDDELYIGSYGSGDFTEFRLTRLAEDNSTELDGWEYSASLAADYLLTVDSGNKSVTASWTSTLSDYIGNFSPVRAWWLQVAPGEHRYKVNVTGGSSNNALVSVDYWDAWSTGG